MTAEKMSSVCSSCRRITYNGHLFVIDKGTICHSLYIDDFISNICVGILLMFAKFIRYLRFLMAIKIPIQDSNNGDCIVFEKGIICHPLYIDGLWATILCGNFACCKVHLITASKIPFQYNFSVIVMEDLTFNKYKTFNIWFK